MTVGVLRLALIIPYSASLKDKRRVIKSLMQKIRNRFNVSIREEPNNSWNFCQITIAAVDTGPPNLSALFEKLKKFIENDGRVEILEHDIDYY